MKKKTYCKPATEVVLLKMEGPFMEISAGTADPKEGGDPTKPKGSSTPSERSPFGNAKPSLWSDEVQTDVE